MHHGLSNALSLISFELLVSEMSQFENSQKMQKIIFLKKILNFFFQKSSFLRFCNFGKLSNECTYFETATSDEVGRYARSTRRVTI